MVEQLDAFKVSDKIKSAIEEENRNTSNSMFNEADKSLASLSRKEQELVKFDLEWQGLLPEISLATGVINDKNSNFVEHLNASNKEGLSSVKGLAEDFVVKNFGTIDALDGKPSGVNSKGLEVLDMIADNQLAAVHTHRDYHGLVEQLKQEYPNDPSIQARESLSREDIDLLLEHPEVLDRTRKQTLEIMRDRFDELSKGNEIDDWSLRKFARTAFPLSEVMPKRSERISEERRNLVWDADNAEDQRIGKSLGILP